MENTYWNEQGRYQADYDRLLELMPGMGKADTVAGELIRACSRIGYDFYNNGMGNNTSGGLNFLRQHRVIDRRLHATLHPYTTGKHYRGKYKGDKIQMAIEELVDLTVKFIIDRPELETLPNHIDILDCEDEMDYRDSYYWDDEDEYEDA